MSPLISGKPYRQVGSRFMSNTLDWTVLFQEEAPRLMRFLRRFGLRVSAEDVRQEAFAKLYASKPSDIASPRAYLKAHDMTERESQEFEAWRNADPEHAKAYAKMERTWSVVASMMKHLKGRAAASGSAPRRKRWRTSAVAIAASALLAIGALAWFTQQPAGIFSQYVETAPGELRTITLADGSTIELSGRSETLLQVTDRERRVDLTAGYALFDVTHDSSRPFVVHTPRGDIRVLGTSFVIRVGENEVRTTVLRGRVSGVPQGLACSQFLDLATRSPPRSIKRSCSTTEARRWSPSPLKSLRAGSPGNSTCWRSTAKR